MYLYLVAPALPPQLDAIGHYTACLAVELARSERVTVLIGDGQTPTPISNVEIASAFSPKQPRSVWEITRQVVQARPDWVILQYNPFSYGRWGFNPHLPLAMRALKLHSPGTRLALMIHEPCVPLRYLKWVLMATWQRWQLRQLGAASEVVFFSIDPWIRRYGAWFEGKPLIHLPVGSNMPRVLASREQARGCLGIGEEVLVLGLFGTLHASLLLDRVRAAAEAVRASGQQLVVLYIGPKGAQLRQALGDLPIIATGPLPAEEVSQRFAAMDIYLSPFFDGISTRRGSMMAALQHGVPLVGTRGRWTDAMLLARDGEAFLLADAADSGQFVDKVLQLAQDPALRIRLSASARQLFDAEFAWDHIASKLLTNLR